MKLSIFLARDKSRTAGGNSKAPLSEMKGLPVRVTTYTGATRTTGAEAVVVLTRGSIRSVVARAGEMDLYLSPRAEYRCIEPVPPKLVDEPLTICAACRSGKHSDCVNLTAANLVSLSAAEIEELAWCECVHGADEYRAVGGAQ